MRNFIRKINMGIVNFILLFAALSGMAYLLIDGRKLGTALIVLIALTLLTLINILIYFAKQRDKLKQVKSLSFYADKETDLCPGSVEHFMLPLVFLDDDGRYIWANDLFRNIFKDERAMLRELDELFVVGINGRVSAGLSDLTTDVSFGGRNFKMFTDVIKAEKKQEKTCLFMIYFVDTTELADLQDEFNRKRTAIGEIAIDSYDEIFQASGEAVTNEISVELSKIFDKWLEGTNAVIKKLVRDRYILIIEDEALKNLEKDKFSVLALAKKISVGNKIPVTLSIGIGARGENSENNYNAASQALELALSRGGDQAVIRTTHKDYYYGGSSVDLESINKVKARVIASMLKSEISKSSNVLIMGHAVADLDALGATLCIHRACTFLGIPSKIILNEGNPSINAALNKLNQLDEYEDVFIQTSYALNLIEPQTLAVVVDTSRQSISECPKLLDYVERVAVIDHHRKSADYIKNTVLDYSETYASSTCELLIEVLQYMIPNASIPPLEAETMYAGIIVDTKNFTLKTGSRTFEVASYLKSQGVNTVSVRQYFQPDMETYSAVSAVTANAKMFSGKIAIAHCAAGTKNQKLVTALAADELLNISGVDASFVISDMGGDNISISGRSFGEVNVQVILEKLGGGGHITAAACVMKGATPEFAERELTKYIVEYLEK